MVIDYDYRYIVYDYRNLVILRSVRRHYENREK